MTKKPQSVDEILAACRRQDGEGGQTPSAAPAEQSAPALPESSEAAAEAAEPAVEPASSGPVDRSKMSVADMLAAARSAAKPAGAAPKAAAKQAAPAGEAAKPAAVDRSKMSVADMLAAARGEQSKPKAAAKPQPKAAAAEPKAAKPAAKAAAAPVASGPKDTASILAAARKGGKPGPISKAEAKARGQEIPTAPAKSEKQMPVMPARPEYVQAAPAPAGTRRSFFSGLALVTVGSSFAIGFASLAVTNILWVLGLARFMFPNILTEPPTKFKVGFPDEYAAGQVQTKFKAQFGVWIVRDQYEGEPQLYALKSVCTHLGCTPNWLEGEQKFKCPCHGSGFYKDGINFEGPAPRPLERYAIRLADDGQLEVDKSRTFQEELGQWADPSCYVTA